MAMPDLGASPLHVASVTYDCTFGRTVLGGGAVAFSVPGVQFVFTFDTGSSLPVPGQDLQDVTWDYSGFSQDAVEAGIVAALGVICGALSTMLGVPPAAVAQTALVRRQWTVGANQTGAAAPLRLDAPFTLTEVMPYPPALRGVGVCGGPSSYRGSAPLIASSQAFGTRMVSPVPSPGSVTVMTTCVPFDST